MRWRLYLFILAITAGFCIMLLTAVTDFNSGDSYQPQLVSAARSGFSAIGDFLNRPETSAPPSQPAPEVRRRGRFDARIRPNSPPLFVPHNADPVLARQDRELKARQTRHAPTGKLLLKLDGDGWHREETALVTAYCPCAKCCGTQSPGITSIGKNAWTPGLAADPLYLDYGTKVFVPGYGMSVIDDTGGAMRRHWRRNGVLHIDVRMMYHYEAKQWGKQYLKVKIYDEN